MLACTLTLAVWTGLCAVPDERPVVRLTESGARNGQAFFSPRGEWISFVSNRSGSWQVWVVRPDGTDARRLTDGVAPASWPSWRPDGGGLFFYAQRDDRYRVLEASLEPGTPAHLFEALEVDAFRPLLSPDGKRLLFDSVAESDAPNHDLFVLELATGSVTQLTHDPGYDSDARWSPDGTRIVFHSDRDAETFHTQVFVMDADGANVKSLTSGPAIHGYPTWSPDGKRIAYTRELAGNRDVWMMDADGGAPEQITFHAGFDGDPAFSPDGERLLFATDRFGGQELAYVRTTAIDAAR